MNENKPHIDLKSTAALLFCIAFAAVAIYLIFKYVFFIFLPFIIAWGLSLIINPISTRLSKKFGIKKRPLSAILMSLLLTFVFLMLGWGISRLIIEAERLLEWIAADNGSLGDGIASLFDDMSSKNIPLIDNLMELEQFREFWENIDVIISGAISEAISSLTKSIPVTVINILRQLPAFLLFVIVTIISCFYFSLDLDKIHSALTSLLPISFQEKLPTIKKRVFGTAAKYLRAYLLLLFLTFGELLVGFSILGVSYPLLIAFLIAIVDILPILGVGTVLIPWAIIELMFTKDLFTGIGLIIIYIVVTVVRQITEPKVVAGSLGLHPLVTIISMYAGFKLIGIFGMILGPMTALAIKSLLKNNDVDTQGH